MPSSVEDLDLVVLGQLLQDVGEPLVVEAAATSRRRLAGRSCRTLARSAGRSVVHHGQQAGRRPAPRRAVDGQPAHLGPRPRRGSRRGAGTPRPHPRDVQPGDHASRGCGPARSRRRRRSPAGRSRAIVTRRSSSSPITRVSPGRCSKRRRLTRPVRDHDLAGVDRGDAGHRQEDPPALHLHDQAEDPRRLVVMAQHHHEVAHLAQLCHRPGRTRRSRTGATRRRARCCQPSQR